MHHQQAGYPRPIPRTVDVMMRLIVFIAVAVAALLLIGWLAFSVIHALILAFWIALIALLGVGLFRVSRWSRRSS